MKTIKLFVHESVDFILAVGQVILISGLIGIVTGSVIYTIGKLIFK
jgi:hypothetical protein